MMKHFPLPLQFQPTRWNKRFQTWDRNCLVASHHPLALNAGAVQMLWWLWSWCGCCRVRGMSTRAATLTSAHTEDINSPSKPHWGSKGWYKQSRLHPNPNPSVAKLLCREAPVLPSPGLLCQAGRWHGGTLAGHGGSWAILPTLSPGRC